MSRYGLTEERYKQLLALYGDDGEVAKKLRIGESRTAIRDT